MAKAKAKAKAKPNPEQEIENMGAKKIKHIAIEDLEPNPYRDFDLNPMDQSRVNELIPSIEKDGLYSPIIIRKNPGPGKPWQVVAMHTRLEASKQLGADTVPCTVLEDCPDARMIRIMTSENSLQKERPAAVRDSVAAYAKPLIKAILISGPDYDSFVQNCEEAGIDPDVIAEAGYPQVRVSVHGGALPGWHIIKPLTKHLSVAQVQNSLGYFRATGLDHKIVASVIRSLEHDPEFQKRREERIKALGVDPDKVEEIKEKTEAELKKAQLEKAKLQTKVLDPSTPEDEAAKAAEALKKADAIAKTKEKELKAAKLAATKAEGSMDIHINGPQLAKKLQTGGEPLVDPAALEGISIEGQVRAILAAFGKDKIGPNRLIPLVEQKGIVQNVINAAHAAGTKPSASDFTSAISAALKAKRELRREEKEKLLTPEQLREREQKDASREFKSAAQQLINSMGSCTGAINTLMEHFSPKRLKKNPGIFGDFAPTWQDEEIDFESFDAEIPRFLNQFKLLSEAAKKAEEIYTANLSKAETEIAD